MKIFFSFLMDILSHHSFRDVLGDGILRSRL
jgi:hypothetical protein